MKIKEHEIEKAYEEGKFLVPKTFGAFNKRTGQRSKASANGRKAFKKARKTSDQVFDEFVQGFYEDKEAVRDVTNSSPNVDPSTYLERFLEYDYINPKGEMERVYRRPYNIILYKIDLGQGRTFTTNMFGNIDDIVLYLYQLQYNAVTDENSRDNTKGGVNEEAMSNIRQYVQNHLAYPEYALYYGNMYDAQARSIFLEFISAGGTKAKKKHVDKYIGAPSLGELVSIKEYLRDSIVVDEKRQPVVAKKARKAANVYEKVLHMDMSKALNINNDRYSPSERAKTSRTTNLYFQLPDTHKWVRVKKDEHALEKVRRFARDYAPYSSLSEGDIVKAYEDARTASYGGFVAPMGQPTSPVFQQTPVVETGMSRFQQVPAGGTVASPSSSFQEQYPTVPEGTQQYVSTQAPGSPTGRF